MPLKLESFWHENDVITRDCDNTVCACGCDVSACAAGNKRICSESAKRETGRSIGASLINTVQVNRENIKNQNIKKNVQYGTMYNHPAKKVKYILDLCHTLGQG